MPPTDVTTIVADFVRQITAAAEATAAARAQAALAAAFGTSTKLGPGRRALTGPAALSRRKRRPKQLCPVPGCTNVAAPVFGMVCAKHKDVPKAKIEAYRAARKAAPAADAKKAGRSVRKVSPKQARARKLQGQYLGALKSLGAADKAKVKAVAREKGVPAALKLAASLKKD